MSQVFSILGTRQKQQPQKRRFLSFKGRGWEPRQQTINMMNKPQSTERAQRTAKSKRHWRVEWENVGADMSWRLPATSNREAGVTEPLSQRRWSVSRPCVRCQHFLFQLWLAPNPAPRANSFPPSVAERSTQNLVSLSSTRLSLLLLMRDVCHNRWHHSGYSWAHAGCWAPGTARLPRRNEASVWRTLRSWVWGNG